MRSKLKISDVGLAGGVISMVTEAKLEQDGKDHAVVIKRTPNKVEGAHFSHSDTELQHAAPRTHLLDRKILERLQNHPEILVPHLHSQAPSTNMEQP